MRRPAAAPARALPHACALLQPLKNPIPWQSSTPLMGPLSRGLALVRRVQQAFHATRGGATAAGTPTVGACCVCALSTVLSGPRSSVRLAITRAR